MHRTARDGYTLLEMIVVLAVLVILGGASSFPTLRGYHSNTRQKAAADGIRARIADARAKAMEQGTWYRLAIQYRRDPHPPRSRRPRLRLPPRRQSSRLRLPSDRGQVRGGRHGRGRLSTPTIRWRRDTAGWRTIATVGPEGICKEDGVLIEVKEKNFAPIEVRVRGVIGNARSSGPSRTGASREGIVTSRERRRPSRPGCRRGLSLIEVLLSLTIFLLALVVLARLVDMGTDRELEARLQTRGTRLALR